MTKIHQMGGRPENRSRGLRDVEVLDPYSEEQIIDIAKELADLALQKRKQEAEKSDFNAKINKAIKELEEKINTHVDQVSRGGVMRTVRADLFLNFDEGVREYRKDGETIKIEPLQDTDYQADAFDAIAENKRREEEAEAVTISEGDEAPGLTGEATGNLPFGDEPAEAPESPEDEGAEQGGQDTPGEESGDSEASSKAPDAWSRLEAGSYQTEDGKYRCQKADHGWELAEEANPGRYLTIAVCGALKDCKRFAKEIRDGGTLEYAQKRVEGAGGKVICLGPYEETAGEDAPTPPASDPFAEYDYFRVTIAHDGEGTYAYQEKGKEPWSNIAFEESLLSWSDAEVQEWCLDNFGPKAADVLEIERR